MKNNTSSSYQHVTWRPSRFLTSALLLSTVCLSCVNKREVIIIGERRDPLNDCETSFIEYRFQVRENELPSLGYFIAWCAIIDGSPELTCILAENNQQETSNLFLPHSLPHTEPDDAHPDWVCWEDERKKWYGENQPQGGAGGQPADAD